MQATIKTLIADTIRTISAFSSSLAIPAFIKKPVSLERGRSLDRGGRHHYTLTPAGGPANRLTRYGPLRFQPSSRCPMSKPEDRSESDDDDAEKEAERG